MKVLITGANGFTASYMIKLLKEENNLDLIYTDCRESDNDKNYHVCDLSDYEGVYKLLQKIKPEQIYHLAGSFSNNYEIDYNANVRTTRNILESCLKLSLNCRILLIGSASEYGFVREEDNPIKEEHPLNPVSIYGLTKVYQSHLMKYYYNNHKLDIVMARTFNLIGSCISNKLFIGRLYEQINEYKSGKISKIKMGNLQNKRDYIDVNEAIKYYKIIMDFGSPGEIYNVGNGKSIKMYDLLKVILKENNLPLDIVEEKLIYNPNKLDIKDIYADIEKLLNLNV